MRVIPFKRKIANDYAMRANSAIRSLSESKNSKQTPFQQKIGNVYARNPISTKNSK